MLYIIKNNSVFTGRLLNKKHWLGLGLSALLLLPFMASAKKSDFTQAIVVDADKQQVQIKKNKVTFYNNVEVTQGSIKLKADKLVVSGTGTKGSEVLVATGKPATFHQILDNGKPVDAQANEIRYELKTRTLTLTGKSELKQLDSVVTGHKVQYNIDKQEMMAEGGEKGRVTTIFLPQQVQELDEESTQ